MFGVVGRKGATRGEVSHRKSALNPRPSPAPLPRLRLPIGLPETDIAGNLSDLIRQAHRSTGQRAVVLIDEYDKPILDNITNSPVAFGIDTQVPQSGGVGGTG